MSTRDVSGTQRGGAAVEFARGVGLLARGAAWCLRAPRLFLLGWLPVAVTAVAYLVGLIALATQLGDLAAVVTWFADDWPDAVRIASRVVAAVALLGTGLLLTVLTFTAVALTVGDPFYERLSIRVEQWCGTLPEEPDVGFWRGLGRSVADSLRLVGISVVAGLALLPVGFLPVLGQTLVPVLGFLVGGWLLAVELVGFPFERRGLRLRDRWRTLRTRPALTLGFGTAVFACFLVPGGAVLVMPAAVAGATLLARRTLGLPESAPGAEGRKQARESDAPEPARKPVPPTDRPPG